MDVINSKVFVHTPLEQFEIIPLLPFNITNATVFTVLAITTFSLLLHFGTYNSTLVPNRWQSVIELLYGIILDMVQDTLGEAGVRYFPFIFTTFTFILSCNLLGMIPYTFTVTSHILITFSLGLATFTGINIIAFRKHGLHFLSFFLPKDVPFVLIPFLVVLEFVSYIFRVFSLSIRLFANMMAGHTLLKILAGFAWTMLSVGGIFYVLHLFPLAIVFALTGLELGIAFLQAYVWTILVCIYLNDAIVLH